MGIVRSRLFRRTTKVLTFAVLIVIALASLRALGNGRIAHAATATYYPAFCLGGWEKPRHASGEVETGSGADPSAFTADNSAYLAPDVSSQIFCGYFPVEARDNPPVSAEIRLVWNFVGATAEESPAAAPAATPSNSPSQPTPATADAPQLDTTAASSTPAAPSSTTTELHTAPAETPPVADPAADPGPQAQPATAPAPGKPSPAPVDPPTTPSVPPAESAPTSLMRSGLRIAGSWILAHTQIAHAQVQADASGTTSLSDWFDVSYSVDGVRWTSIGRVNAQNWKDFTVHIPLTSWDDLQNVQIMVAALPSLTERPAVYLDGMELRTENDATLSENVAAAADAASGFVDAATGTLASIGDSLLSLVGKKAPEDAQPTIATDSPPTPVPVAKRRVLTFAVHGDAVPVSDALPWQEKEIQDKQDGSYHTATPEIAVSEDNRSFIVSGSCSQKYAVVITYRNADDYAKNPRSSLANVATACEDGHYSFNLGGLPDSTQGGTYYLLIGEEGDTGTWTPASALLPISISPIEVEE